MISVNKNINDDNPSALPVVPVKPTSRARAYRIPKNSEHAALAGNHQNVAVDNIDKNAANTNDSFLWATREIAALDFLMNVPLSAEKDIVRAGLSGGRWHRHNSNNKHKQQPLLEEEEIKSWGGTIAMNNKSLSTFDVARNSEDEIGRVSDVATELSSIHSPYQSTAAVPDQRWWDRLVRNDKRFFSAANQQARRREQLELEEKELERPTESPSLVMMGTAANLNRGVAITSDGNDITSTPTSTATTGVPGRRLDGIDAITVTLPEEFRVRPAPLRTVARKAAVREWEIRVAYGQGRESHSNTATPRNALLDGRCFFSTKKSYPIAVFSTIKYEPKREETLRRRKMLEELGGGGTQFILPERDWRGISYRALLPQDTKQKESTLAFNRLLGSNTSPTDNKRRRKKKVSSPYENSSDEDDDTSSVSSSESSVARYPLGFLDDPQMTQGRNRNVMMGDKVTGPVICSTVAFVKPRELKNDLNKQFKERFDGWEPHKSQRKFIGAKIIDGVYTLIDPTEKEDINLNRVTEMERIRMPPSLTLSKIRSLKQQALVACVRGRIEISTLALACIYFERLCLDCRVDKSNRRLSFAACLLLAAKTNESNSVIAYDCGTESKSDTADSQLLSMTSFVRPNKKSGKIFESLIVFFTHDWSLSLKELYAAEWIVFTSLGFSLTAKPSEVAFHFKRLLKTLEWNPRSYLGNEMYRQWLDALAAEARQNEKKKLKRKRRIERNERKLTELYSSTMQPPGIGEQTRRKSSISGTEEVPYSSSRRHSTESIVRPSVSSLSQVRRPASASAQYSEQPHGEGSPGRKGVRGILSRLSRRTPSRHSDFEIGVNSHGNLDKLSPKSESMRQSVSFPNLSSLDTRKDDVVIEFKSIHEDEQEIFHSDGSINREDDDEGLFVV